MVAYVVPEGDPDPAALRAAVRDVTGNGTILVALSALPRDAQGSVDDLALETFAAFDEAAVADAAARLSARYRQVDVTFAAVQEAPPRVHRSRLSARGPSSVRRPISVATNERPARLDGLPPAREADAPATLHDALLRVVNGTRGIVHVDEQLGFRETSYAKLLEEAQCVHAAIRDAGVTAGAYVFLQLERAADFLPAFWGCTLAGAVPVAAPVPPGDAPETAPFARLRYAWDMLGRPVVVATGDRMGSLQALGNADVSPRVVAIEDALKHAPASGAHEASAGDAALVLLTSGSTGAPKCVVQTHRSLLAMAAAWNQREGMTSVDTMLNFFAFNHVGTIVFASLMPLICGAGQVHIVPGCVLASPLIWLDALERFGATLTWAPNFAFTSVVARLAQEPDRRWNLRAVRSMISGGEAVLRSTVTEFIERLAPHGLRPDAVVPSFGMSETCSAITLWRGDPRTLPPGRDVLPLGTPMPGAGARIVDDAGEIVNEGVEGHFHLRGPALFAGYAGDPEATAATLRDGWLVTGDLAAIVNGEIIVTGRVKETIVLNGEKYGARELEAIVETVDGVAPGSVVALDVRASDGADQLAIFIDRACAPDDVTLASSMRAIASALSERAGIRPDTIVALDAGAIPRSTIGKVQRAALRESYHAGAYRAEIERADVLLANDETIPAWFFVPRQVHMALANRPLSVASAVLIGDGELASSLARTLAARNVACVSIRAGVRDLAGAFAAAGARRGAIELVVLCDSPDTPQGDFADRVAGLAAAVNALGSYGAPGGTSLCVVAKTQTPDVAALAGFLRAAVRERVGLRARVVTGIDGSDAAAVTRVLDECADPHNESAVHYRGDARLVQRFSALDFEHTAPTPIINGGTYVVAGGLGGVGRLIAHALRARYAARVLLLGRTPRERLDGERAEALRGLEALNNVAYAAVDIADRSAVDECVKSRLDAWNVALDGVFNLAGIGRERPLHDETPHSLSDGFRAKVDGSRVLSDLVPDREGTLYCALASTAAIFGGSNVSTYAAANAFQIAYGGERAARRSGRSVTVISSAWQQTGMARAVDGTLLCASGQWPMAAADALLSIEAALATGEPVVAIGLHGGHAAARHWNTAPPVALHRLVAFAEADARATETLADAFGMPVTVDVLPLQERSAGNPVERIAPRSELERRIAATWCAILRVTDPGIDQSFFMLGGDSLRAAQVASRLRSDLGTTVTLPQLFAHPTIAGIASSLRANEPRADELAERRARIERMSPDEVRAELASQRR